MTHAQLVHAIRAACNVSGDDELLIFGSQAIHGSFPDPPASLTTSVEVDIQPKNHPEKTIDIDGALGEGSPFHSDWGFYVHGVLIENAVLPTGWEKRCAPVFSGDAIERTGWCVETHDLAASKLVAFRDKDRQFVRTLLAEQLVSAGLLESRVHQLELSADQRESLLRWLRITVEDLVEDE
ncbi:MAG: hypothetical protein ACI84D_000668 [Thalassolituus oleivorans]|jgi:hypothetical protein